VEHPERIQPRHPVGHQRLALAVHHQLQRVNSGLGAVAPPANEQCGAATDRHLGRQLRFELYV